MPDPLNADGPLATAALFDLRDTLGLKSVSELRGATLPGPAQEMLDRALGFFHVNREQVFDGIERLVGFAQDEMPVIIASGGRAILSTVIMLIALYFLLVEGARVVEWASRVSPLDARQTAELTAELRKVTKATVTGILATAIFQGVAAGHRSWLRRLTTPGLLRHPHSLGSL